MPRIGMNPARHRISSYQPARVTVAVLTHIPTLTGYFRHRFDILRLCLASILANTAQPYDLLVFDNGSCEPVVDYLRGLRDSGDIHYLLLSSQNIGKIGAFQMLFRAAPGDIVAYCDDDVFYLPDWLEAHLEVLDTFPKVGMVSGKAIRIRFLDQTETNQSFANHPDVIAERGKFIPESWERAFVENTGRDWEAYRSQTEPIEDLLFRYKGVEAFATANHFQFVIPRRVALEALPKDWGGQLMGQMVELDRAIDQQGYLRLSTRQRYTRMMGNTLDAEVESLADSLKLSLQTKVPRTGHRGGKPNVLQRSPLIMRLARVLYDRLYWLIHE